MSMNSSAVPQVNNLARQIIEKTRRNAEKENNRAGSTTAQEHLPKIYKKRTGATGYRKHKEEELKSSKGTIATPKGLNPKPAANAPLQIKTSSLGSTVDVTIDDKGYRPTSSVISVG